METEECLIDLQRRRRRRRRRGKQKSDPAML
jgi:hypothetical protein